MNTIPSPPNIRPEKLHSSDSSAAAAANGDISATALYQTLNALMLPSWVGDSDAHDGFLNQVWRTNLTSQTPEPNNHWLPFVAQEDREAITKQWQQHTARGRNFQFECRLQSSDGSLRWHSIRVAKQPNMRAREGKAAWWQVIATDIHERVINRHYLTSHAGNLKSMLDASVDCIKMLSPDGLVTHMNASGCTALGVCESSGFGQTWLDLLPPEVRHRGQRALAQARRGKNARFDGMSVSGNKVQYWDNILTPVLDAHGQTSVILCVSRDITLQRQAEKRLRIASEIDELTRLPNRHAFKSYVTKHIQKASVAGTCVGLMLLDLDHFKHVNDTLGHAAGDHLLHKLSKRLQDSLPEQAFVARLGGDEFAVVHSGFLHMDEFLQLAEKIHHLLDTPITYSGKVISGGMSIGCAIYPRDADDLSGLLKCADTALNDIKAGGRGGIRLYSVRMMQATLKAAEQLDCARTIVRDGSIVPHYQPKVMLHNHQVIGFEALLRWRGDDGTLYSPKTVEEAFKNYEVATKISDAIRKKVFADISNWLTQGLQVLPISLNAAPVEFLRDDYASRLLEQMKQHRIPPELIEIEVTEHTLTERSSEYVGRALRELKRAGVRIALDDFGTGHSSFAHLRDYPVDCIKIDCDFVRRMQEDPVIAAIVAALCQLGPALNLQIIAEGVETKPQCDILLKAGCTVGQGFLFNAALPASAAATLLLETAKAHGPTHTRAIEGPWTARVVGL